jgi:hypothetical protein
MKNPFLKGYLVDDQREPYLIRLGRATPLTIPENTFASTVLGNHKTAEALSNLPLFFEKHSLFILPNLSFFQ